MTDKRCFSPLLRRGVSAKQTGCGIKDFPPRSVAILNCFLILLLLSLSYYNQKIKTYAYGETRLMLSTQIEIKVVSKSKSVQQLVDKAFDQITQYELKFSYYHPDSFLHQINNSESVYFRIDNEFYEVLSLAEKIYYESNHLYDVTIGDLFDTWDFENEAIPDSVALAEAMENIGFDKLILKKDSLFKPNNIKINLNSLCKGYIVDKVIEFLIKNGAEEAIVNAGGDLRFYSNNKNKWVVAVQNPRDRFSTIASLRIPDKAVVTSGDYERFFEQENQRYHHILNPQTGYPTSQTVSVTVLSSTAFVADALATAAMVMHPFEALELIKKYPNTDAIIYFFDENDEIISIKTDQIKNYKL
ncbi:MAG: FAD:protein FMN transferase [Candidatus Cloacimonetes bacterium]|nr:FAD:protein FMN transferase [Candidatus Cloacimonadota bacterium]